MSNTTSLQSFIKSFASNTAFTVQEAMEATGFNEAKTLRRLNRSKSATLTDDGWVTSVPEKSEGGDKKASRKARREKRKVDLIRIREELQAKKFSEVAIDTAESECSVTRREAFKEARARVSQNRNLRITHWKAKGETIVTGLGVSAFR